MKIRRSHKTRKSKVLKEKMFDAKVFNTDQCSHSNNPKLKEIKIQTAENISNPVSENLKQPYTCKCTSISPQMTLKLQKIS